MCGIVGSINCKFAEDYLSVIEHRGPDDSGETVYKNVTLGHRRLSILDTSSAGHQPMAAENGSIEIVFNGEIYNHLELRDKLINEGYKFKSGSDTETLIKGWHCWGKEVVEKLNGIFSFAILDKRSDHLFLVRDHFGIKPLYIYEKDNKIAFSSELKIFAHLNDFDDTLNTQAFMQYVSFLWAPGEQSPYKFVHKLLPGHILEIPLSNPNQQKTHEYYRLSFEGNYLPAENEQQIIDQLDEHLQQAVERQLLSDVPLGFFLSGGLDSSLLVAIARHLYPDTTFNCFTIAAKMNKRGDDYEDDLPYAKKVAEHLDVNLNVIESDSSITNQFDHMMWHLDEPQADPSPIHVYNISKGARERGIKVLLGGTAGDDLFSGYRRHRALTYESLVEYVPHQIRSAAQAGLKKLPSDKTFARRLQRFSRDWEKPLRQRILGYFNWLPDDEYVFSLFQKQLYNGHSKRSIYSYFEHLLDQQNSDLSVLDQLLYLEIKTFLVDHNLNYTDKMSMAAGVEARVPYLDKDLVEFAGRIPAQLKFNKGETKYILKKVAERYLPDEVIYRSKTGFGSPLRNWFKGELRPMLNERLNTQHLTEQGIFNPEVVQNMIKFNDSGKYDFGYNLWSMLAIQSWLKQFKWSI